MKIVLFGAGSAQFGYEMLGGIFQSSVLKGSQIVLVDINGEALKKVHHGALDCIEEHNLDFTLTASTERKEVLKGADFVIISIEVGDRFALWDMDWKIPMQYGIKQVYGENGGPGGLFHALRITPRIVEICDDVVKLCPDALVINYSNPMTAVTTTVLRKYPQLKFLGLCHEIFSLTRYLPTILNTNLDNLRFRAAGLNHFNVLLELTYRDSGRDAYPDLLEKAPAFFEKEPGLSDAWDHVRRTGKIPETKGPAASWDVGHASRSWSDRTLVKTIMEMFRVFPITDDSHLGEYISWAQDAVDHQGILDFYSFYRYHLTQGGESKIELEVNERAVPVMEGVVTNAGFEEAAVNIMNRGSIPDFPGNVAVEVPAIINAGGAEGIRFDTYPKGFGALIRAYAGVYDLTAEAVLTGRKDYVIQAVLANPVVDKCRAVPSMVDAMLSRQREWLEYIH